MRLHANKVEYNGVKSRKQLLGDHVFVLYDDAPHDGADMDDVGMWVELHLVGCRHRVHSRIEGQFLPNVEM